MGFSGWRGGCSKVLDKGIEHTSRVFFLPSSGFQLQRFELFTGHWASRRSCGAFSAVCTVCVGLTVTAVCSQSPP